MNTLKLIFIVVTLIVLVLAAIISVVLNLRVGDTLVQGFLSIFSIGPEKYIDSLSEPLRYRLPTLMNLCLVSEII